MIKNFVLLFLASEAVATNPCFRIEIYEKLLTFMSETKYIVWIPDICPYLGAKTF